MDVFIRGKGSVRLSQADFVAQGGEGSVYVKGDLAYKIYTDPQKMIAVAKIQELAELTAPNIIRPQDVLLNSRNMPIGYTMRRVQDAFPLCQLFTRAFRERKGITNDVIVGLVQKLQQGVQHVHDRGMLIVDLNEMNFLVDSALQEVLFIDVDSYQTRGFPATAIMESIRDRHTTSFSILTDWFAFGIVSFQMFIGIHPYKGRHPSLSDLDSRMQANVSVLNPQVALPHVCYPLDVIPQAYRRWYQAIFEEGQRLPPPTDLQGAVVIVPRQDRITGSEKLKIEEVYTFPADVLFPVPAAGSYVAMTSDGLYARGRRYSLGQDAKIGFTPRRNEMIAAWQYNRELKLYNVTQDQEMPVNLACAALMGSQGRIYVKNGGSLSLMEFLELPAGTQATLRPVANVLENASQLFEGVVIQSLLGACYALLLPADGTSRSLRIPELDAYQIVEARCENGVLMVVGVQSGRYDKFILRVSSDYSAYDLRKSEDITYTGLNFVTLDSDVCLHLNENEELELFSNQKDRSGLRLLTDPILAGVRLFRNGTQALFTRGNTVYSMSLR